VNPFLAVALLLTIAAVAYALGLSHGINRAARYYAERLKQTSDPETELHRHHVCTEQSCDRPHDIEEAGL
jgi:hypothetical protein